MHILTLPLHSWSRRVPNAGYAESLDFLFFKATPNVSVQIISSISAVPMRVNALKITETDGSSGTIETRIIVEAEPIFDVPAAGFYFANLVVIGIPIAASTTLQPAQLLR